MALGAADLGPIASTPVSPFDTDAKATLSRPDGGGLHLQDERRALQPDSLRVSSYCCLRADPTGPFAGPTALESCPSGAKGHLTESGASERAPDRFSLGIPLGCRHRAWSTLFFPQAYWTFCFARSAHQAILRAGSNWAGGSRCALAERSMDHLTPDCAA